MTTGNVIGLVDIEPVGGISCCLHRASHQATLTSRDCLRR